MTNNIYKIKIIITICLSKFWGYTPNSTVGVIVAIGGGLGKFLL